MSASTTRLSLTKPGGGSTGLIMPPDPVDIDVINANMDKIDASIGTNWYSSTTRPASPFDGQAIMETDTGALAVWRTSLGQWVYLNAAVTVADLNALAAQSAAFEGRRFHVDALNVDFQAIDGIWVQQGVASVASTAIRNTEYAKAAGAYRVGDVEALDTATGITSRYVGAAWKTWSSAWLTYTPALTNIVLGAGTLRGIARYTGGDVEFEIDLSLGAGGSMGTTPLLGFYVNMASDYLADAPVGTGIAVVAGTNYPLEVWRNSASTMAPYLRNVAATYETINGISAAVPGAWSTTGRLQLRGKYRPV